MLSIDHSSLEKLRKKNIQHSILRFSKMAISGDSQANYVLGYLYEHGSKSLSPDYKKAIFHYKKYYEETKDITGLLALAQTYMNFLNKPQLAFDIYSKLEEYEIDVVYLNLGVIHERGLIATKNSKLAMEYYDKAYRLGNINGGIYFTYLCFAIRENNTTSCFFKHQWLRLKAFLISIVDKYDMRIKQG